MIDGAHVNFSTGLLPSCLLACRQSILDLAPLLVDSGAAVGLVQEDRRIPYLGPAS